MWVWLSSIRFIWQSVAPLARCVRASRHPPPT
jgi:hypothetical protein